MNANAVTIVAALIGLTGTLIAAFITKPHGVPQPQPAWSPSSPGSRPPARATGGYVMPTLKTSRSLWWGLAGLVLWLLPILGYIVTLPGLFTAIRDIRSPGTRRYAMIGLVLCLLAFTLTIINSAIGAYEGAHGTGWWQHG